jgi:hypothetical protein
MNPQFSPGKNIAMKVPAHEYEKTVSFYRDTLRFEELAQADLSSTDSVRFSFGDKVLWIDCVPGLSQAEIWLEVITDDPENAADYLQDNNCIVCNNIEPLLEDFKGFWIASPSNIIHLVAGE